MNHYITLGLTPSATPEEVTTAYRTMRSGAHPDKQGDAAQFHKIQAAYEVLSDPARRAKYDQSGDDTVEEGRALRTLIEMLVNVVDQREDDSNPLTVCQDNIEQNLYGLQHNIRVAEHKAVKMDKASKRIAKKSGGQCMMSQALTHHAADLRKQIVRMNAELDFGAEMLELLTEFEYH
jgi:DnaJ-class molecular chaperone